jgi:tRNA (cmo5U34)-methyltransferase
VNASPGHHFAAAQTAHLQLGNANMTGQTAHFANPVSAQTYAENARRMVPGLSDLHRMTLILLSEHAPPDARVLVLGAGGGMELKLFAENRPTWRFDGVDPSRAMLTLAKDTLGPLMDRITLHEGYIDTAADGPFDAATCLLTLHFLARADRLHTLQQIRRRMKPGAAFVMAHHSIARDGKSRADWTRRFAAYAAPDGPLVDPARPSIFDQLPILAPDQEEALLQEAGFGDVTAFYTAFSFRGWVAYA